ncbi:MAG: S8 family peptidase [Rhodospirillaceae bacterium]|nr:S8 family peptidase [Rhodospirillaceae bacterium]
MRIRQRIGIAAWMAAALPVVPVTAQELRIRPMSIGERPVLLLPGGDAPLSANAAVAGVRFDLSTLGDLRIYRATYAGQTYTAYADLSGPPRRYAFDLAERRFRVVTSTIRVELYDFDQLNPIVLEHGARSGKAYPELGFALIELGPETDPGDVVAQLDVDPRVAAASVQFERPLLGPMIVTAPSVQPPGVPNGGEVFSDAKESLRSDLYVSFSLDISEPEFTIDISVRNLGAGRSGLATFRSVLYGLVPDRSTPDPHDLTLSEISTDDELLFGLDAKGTAYKQRMAFSDEELEAGRTYYVKLEVVDGIFPPDDAEVLARRFTGFTLDSLKRVQHVCIEPGRGSVTGVPDPLLAQQWHLNNTGQSGYADGSGVAGEDLRMQGVLRDGPTGEAVKVAVVDAGLEICHPDLKASVEAGASFNFNALLTQFPSAGLWAYRVESTDPFNFDPTDGHGTAVAGLIAAQADNGTGGRGVAPGVQLRGYNMLNADNQLQAFIDSLGASTFLPNSTDVDIFNMSFGGFGTRPSNPDVVDEQVFANGSGRLRSGLGSLYVKAAGNAFNACYSLVRALNLQIGCMSSVADATNNLPYVIVVGAFNADGKKSSYASAGPNLWISAPGGEYGTSEPALLTTDPMGWSRGIPLNRRLRNRSAPLDDETTVNPDGDYTGLMNGTSAAAPNVSGAIAVLLEAAPQLTWRDVKHILATTARRIDPDIAPVEATFGVNTRTVRLGWTENAAGYAYHDWYGFGALDLDAALTLARQYTPDALGAFQQSGWFESAGAIAIPDNDGMGAAQRLRVSGLADDANIEAVALEVDTRHPFPNDLGIHLVSPQGTRSVVNQVFNETLAVEDMDTLRWRLLSNAFYGENPNGDWQIEVFDAAAGDTGRLHAWRLRFYFGDHPDAAAENDTDTTTDDMSCPGRPRLQSDPSSCEGAAAAASRHLW